MSAYQHTGYRNDLSPEERAAYVERVKAMFAAKRERGQIEGEVEEATPTETLDELEQDDHAGRVLKFDLRVTPDEKLRWSHAARSIDLSASEFVRVCVNTAAAEILANEGVPAPLLR